MTSGRSGLRPRRRDRGQSVTINYTLSLIIVTVLISGLFIAMSGYLDDERERVTRSELTVLGNRIAADVATADRLARTTDAGGGRVEVRTNIPRTVAGTEYTVDIESTAFNSEYWDVTITLRAPDVNVGRTVGLRTDVEVRDSSINGGPFYVEYDGSKLEVHDG